MYKQKGFSQSIMSILVMILITFSTTLSSKELLVLLSDDQKIHNEISALIVNQSSLTVTTRLYHEHTRSAEYSDNKVILSIGTRACNKALENLESNEKVVCTLIPAQTYKALITKHSITDNKAHRVTAVFMDQPIDRQIALARLVSPNAKSIGTVFGQTSVAQRAEFERIGLLSNFETHIAFLDEAQNPVQILTPLIQRSDVFLAIPDNANFNRSVSRWALYITLRNKIPLIGFSSSYSEAGAVVSLYSTTEQLAYQTHETIVTLLNSETLVPAAYPNDFTIMINESTARTLRMNLPDSQELSKQLKEIHK
ncbi:MAG: hypothetical protein EA373_13045 [Oceanospirillales bacterium]|nr:MAG: hypothetical protein EA373_13045 [Oceanospirillales bacterium]